MKYKVISTDDHLQEAADTWTARMSKQKWGDKIPQVVSNDDGTDSWSLWGEKRRPQGVAVVLGAMPDTTKPPDRWEEVPKSTYVPSERLKAMGQDGVDVHTFFGNVSGIAGNTFSAPNFADEEFRLECIRAYNDFQIDEWADPYPGRFITLAQVPLWDVEKAKAELWRNKKRGIHGICFAFPQQFKYPHIADRYWDPFWEAAVEADLPVNLHIGSGGSQGMPAFEGHPAMLSLADGSVKIISANIQVMSTIVFSGILERFPQLKMVSAESGLGWVPYMLETADHQWERQQLWRLGMSAKPSEYFHRQCYVQFWYEVVGLKMREHIGLDNIMWESDFPHPTCTWPDSQEYIKRGTAEMTAEERHKVLVGNAVKLYHLERYQD